MYFIKDKIRSERNDDLKKLKSRVTKKFSPKKKETYLGKYIQNALDNKSEISSNPILPHLDLTPTPSTSKNIGVVEDDVKVDEDDSRDTDFLPPTIHTPSFGKININNKVLSVLSPPESLSTPHHHQTMTPHENVDR